MQGKSVKEQDKMSFDGFCKCVQMDLQKQFSNVNVTVQLQTITKNNGQKHKAIVISETGCKTAPTIYLEGYYNLYLNGMDMEQVEHKIVKQYVENSGLAFDTKKFTEWSNVCERIVYKLVNYERNKELLETIPNRRFLDLAVTYYVLLDNMADSEFQCATIQITNNHLQIWNKTEADLYQCALENTFVLLPYEFTGIENAELAENDNPSFMYVLTNDKMLYGSASILYQHLLSAIAERTGADLLYILPSSIHEVIILPAVKGYDCSELVEMVRSINQTELSADNILSDNVYFYSKEKDEISICNEVAENE